MKQNVFRNLYTANVHEGFHRIAFIQMQEIIAVTRFHKPFLLLLAFSSKYTATVSICVRRLLQTKQINPKSEGEFQFSPKQISNRNFRFSGRLFTDTKVRTKHTLHVSNQTSFAMFRILGDKVCYFDFPKSIFLENICLCVYQREMDFQFFLSR